MLLLIICFLAYLNIHKAAKEEEKVAAIKELKNQVQENLKGTLFETDTSQLDNIRLGKPQLKTKKQTTKKTKIEQPKLF